jgi:hypothetical protein
VAVRDFLNSVEGLHDALKIEAQRTLIEITASNAVNQETKKKIFVTCALAKRWWHSKMEFNKV